MILMNKSHSKENKYLQILADEQMSGASQMCPDIPEVSISAYFVYI